MQINIFRDVMIFKSKKSEKAFLFLIGTFANTSTLGQLIVMEQYKVTIPILLVNLAVLIWFLTVYFSDKPPFPTSKNINDLNRWLDSNDLIFHYIRSSYDLEYIWALDSKAYGEYNIHKSTLADWFEKYPSGCLIMKRGANFLGYVGIYPLHADTFEKIKNRSMSEDDIRSHDICSIEEARACRTWYFSGFLLTEPKFFNPLLMEAMNNWAISLPENADVHAISYAYEGPDANFLAALKFFPIADVKDTTGLPIVIRTFNKREVENIVNKARADVPPEILQQLYSPNSVRTEDSFMS